jgi:hypothetical protein
LASSQLAGQVTPHPPIEKSRYDNRLTMPFLLLTIATIAIELSIVVSVQQCKEQKHLLIKEIEC